MKVTVVNIIQQLLISSNVIQFWMLLTTVTFIRIWMINVIQILDVNACHPNLDGRFHQLLDVYCVIQKWMIVGC